MHDCQVVLIIALIILCFLLVVFLSIKLSDQKDHIQELASGKEDLIIKCRMLKEDVDRKNLQIIDLARETKEKDILIQYYKEKEKQDE